MRWQLAIRLAFLFPLCVAQQAMGEDSLPWVFNAPAADGYSIALNSIADRGLVVLVLQDEKNQPVSSSDGKSVSQEVAAPEGTLVLKQTLTVPRKAKELRLFIPLVPDGLETTTGEVTIRYPVVKK
jgi:hypothetical protein